MLEGNSSLNLAKGKYLVTLARVISLEYWVQKSEGSNLQSIWLVTYEDIEYSLVFQKAQL